MRIALSVLHITKKGGAERTAANLANEMTARGHEVLIHSATRNHLPSAYPLAKGIRHVQIPLRNGMNVDRIRKRIGKFDPDVAFLFYFDHELLWQYATVVGLGAGIGAQECTNPKRAVVNLARTDQFGDAYAAFSAREAFLAGMHGIRLTMNSFADTVPLIARQKTVTFPNAYALAPAVANANPDGRKTIINVGGLKGPNKNGVVLAAAFDKIAAQFPDWDLKYFGGEGLRSKIPAVVTRRNTMRRISVNGYVNTIHEEYSRSQIHVICSHHEGCPNAVCEAMTHGIPSIGYADCPGTNELIRHGQNGLLVERADEVDNLAAALSQMMSDVEMRARFGRQAYDDAADLFDPKALFDKWEALLETIAAYKGQPDRLVEEQRKTHERSATHLEELRKRFVGNALATPSKFTRVNQDNAPLVSFIIPLFNKEQFIEETLQSIADCTYPNKEIIIVDDCCTDRSPELAAAMADKIPNLRLVKHDRNRGLSAARNTGLEHATGKYIQFWDADDVYDRESLSQIITEMEEDFSQIGTGLAVRDGEVLFWYRGSEISRRRTNFDLCPESFSTNSTCFKVYRRDFLNDHSLRFVEGLFIQDAEFNLRAFPRAQRITVTPYRIGEYRRFEGSASKIISGPRVESSLEIGRLTSSDYTASDFGRFEAFRQAKLITFVYRFFLKRLLRIEAGELSEAERSVVTNELQDPQIVDSFLKRFEEEARALGPGIASIATTEPRTALAFMALAEGHRDWAYSLLNNRLPPIAAKEALEPKAAKLGIADAVADVFARMDKVGRREERQRTGKRRHRQIKADEDFARKKDRQRPRRGQK